MPELCSPQRSSQLDPCPSAWSYVSLYVEIAYLPFFEDFSSAASSILLSEFCLDFHIRLSINTICMKGCVGNVYERLNGGQLLGTIELYERQLH